MYQLYTLDFYKKHITNPCSDKNNILFGTYDNIKFSSIKKYSDAEKMISISQYNVLDSNKRENLVPDYPTSIIVLYSLEENEYAKELWKSDFKSEKELDFLCVILFSAQSYHDNLSYLSEELHKQVADDKEIIISCFGTFGMYDMCVVVRAISIKKVIDFVDSLYENVNIRSINTSYSIVSYIGDSKEKERKLIDQKGKCKYIANIQITCTSKKARKNILFELQKYLGDDYKKIVSYAVLGEYDMCIHIPANVLPLRLYQQDGMLNSYSEFCQKNIIQSCTRISKKETIDDFVGNSIEDKNYISSNDLYKQKEKVHEKIIEKIKKLTVKKELYNFPLNRILQLAYIDFCKAYFVAPQNCAISDLECQFISTIDCIDQILNREKDVGNKQVYEVASDLAEMLSKKIYTVIQENNYAIVEPYSYLYNTGILQDIIHMYESFIKKFLAIIYAHCSIKQSELIPVVSIDAAVDIPMSDLFIYNENKTSVKNDKQNSDQLRIISIKLPLDVILRPEMYLPLLIHEVIHYLCPHNRILRNKIIFRIYMEHYFLVMISTIYKGQSYCINEIMYYVCKWFNINFVSIFYRLNILKNSELDFESKSLTFSSQVENLFDRAFSKYSGNEADNSELYKIFKEFVVYLKEEAGIEICTDMNDLHHTIVYYGRNKECIQEINGISDGLKELICDIFMCEFFNLDVVSYFSLITLSILNQNIKCEYLISGAIRFGGIVKWQFKNKGFDINKYSEDIIKMVCNFNPRYKSRRKDINEILEMLNYNVKMFSQRFSIYINEINDYINCYKIKSYCTPSDILDNYSKISLKTFTEALEAVHVFFDGFKSSDLSENDYTLKNAIKLIQLLPNDLSLNDLNAFYNISRLNKHGECSNEYPEGTVKRENSICVKDNVLYTSTTDIYIYENGIESAIRLAKRKLIDDDTPNDSLWYRGQVNASWGVAPALFRNCNNNFRDKLIDAYELFRAQACESLEIHTNIDSDSDWIACMQHYFVPTHFLDWSEQPLTSLYFALENYFDYPCKYFKQPIPECDFEKMRSQCSSDSALFVLNPNRMNRILSGLNGVPNISIPRNELLYKNYVLPNRGDCGAVEMKTSKDFFSQPSSENNCWKYMPMAVITSQLNSRIKAQKGHFVAYNLQVNYPIPPKEEDKKKETLKATSVCDLYAIQKELYRICCEKGKKFKPFIAKIIIPNSSKEEVYNTLKAYGINKSSFYPELMHIGTDVSKIVF